MSQMLYLLLIDWNRHIVKFSHNCFVLLFIWVLHGTWQGPEYPNVVALTNVLLNQLKALKAENLYEQMCKYKLFYARNLNKSDRAKSDASTFWQRAISFVDLDTLFWFL